MAQFLITYDNHPPRNYTRLYQLMATWKAVRAADSVWLANLKGPAPVVRDFVLQTLQPNDNVVVVEIKQGSDWATSAATPFAARTWLANNVTPSQAAA